MPEAVFDTLAYARRLREGGVGDAQAEAHADALRAAFNEGVATKADLALLEAKIERGVNRTLLAVITVGGVVVAIIASAFAVIDRLP